jgi:hypothetical protein
MGNVLMDKQDRQAFAQFSEGWRCGLVSPTDLQPRRRACPKGRCPGACAIWRAVRLNRYAESAQTASEFSFAEGRTKEAVAQFAEALRIDPGFADARLNLQAAEGSVVVALVGLVIVAALAEGPARFAYSTLARARLGAFGVSDLTVIEFRRLIMVLAN